MECCSCWEVVWRSRPCWAEDIGFTWVGSAASAAGALSWDKCEQGSSSSFPQEAVLDVRHKLSTEPLLRGWMQHQSLPFSMENDFLWCCNNIMLAGMLLLEMDNQGVLTSLIRFVASTKSSALRSVSNFK